MMAAIVKNFDAADIAAGLDSRGFVCIPDAISPEWLERAARTSQCSRRRAADAISRSTGQGGRRARRGRK